MKSEKQIREEIWKVIMSFSDEDSAFEQREKWGTILGLKKALE